MMVIFMVMSKEAWESNMKDAEATEMADMGRNPKFFTKKGNTRNVTERLTKAIMEFLNDTGRDETYPAIRKELLKRCPKDAEGISNIDVKELCMYLKEKGKVV